MKDDRQHPDDAIEAFLDGTLPPDEHAQMRLLIENDAAMKDECRRQAALDTSLLRLFTPPAVPSVGTSDQPSSDHRHAPRPRRSPTRWSRFRVPAIAAMVLIALGMAAWSLVDLFFPETPSTYSTGNYPVHRNPTTFVAEYHALVNAGFKPDWVCQTQAQFVQTFQSNLGQPLLFEPGGTDISMVGLSYANILSERTIVFLGKVHDAPALVFVDRMENDKPQSLPPGGGLHLFHRQLGGLILYELTPLDQPMLLSGFYQPPAHCP